MPTESIPEVLNYEYLHMPGHSGGPNGVHFSYKIYCEKVTVGCFGAYMLVFISYQYYLQCGVIKKTEYTYYCRIAKLVSVVAISIALKLASFNSLFGNIVN